jgi:hypothetical protein
MILTGENRRTRRKPCNSAILSTTNPPWTDPGANSGLRCETPATNRVTHGTVSISRYLHPFFLLVYLKTLHQTHINCTARIVAQVWRKYWIQISCPQLTWAPQVLCCRVALLAMVSMLPLLANLAFLHFIAYCVATSHYAGLVRYIPVLTNSSSVQITEHCGPDSYSGGPGVKSRLEDSCDAVWTFRCYQRLRGTYCLYRQGYYLQ